MAIARPSHGRRMAVVVVSRAYCCRSEACVRGLARPNKRCPAAELSKSATRGPTLQRRCSYKRTKSTGCCC
eukprot:1369925-Lingulodinium_polyedra.AAC.1